MRAICKLLLLIVLAWFMQQGVRTARENAAELKLSWAILLADIRGTSLDAPDLLDLAAPLLEIHLQPPALVQKSEQEIVELNSTLESL